MKLLRRNPSSFTPCLDGRYLLLGMDKEENHSEISKFSKNDADAYPSIGSVHLIYSNNNYPLNPAIKRGLGQDVRTHTPNRLRECFRETMTTTAGKSIVENMTARETKGKGCADGVSMDISVSEMSKTIGEHVLKGESQSIQHDGEGLTCWCLILTIGGSTKTRIKCKYNPVLYADTESRNFVGPIHKLLMMHMGWHGGEWKDIQQLGQDGSIHDCDGFMGTMD